MNRITSLGVVAILLIATGIVAAAGGSYFWKQEKIADFQGEVEGINVETETVTINLGSLHPGQWFTTKGYSVNISHNCYGRIDMSLWLDNRPYGALDNLWISGNVTNKDSNTTIWYFGENLMQKNIEIKYVPMNATINFKISGTVGYPNDDFDLSNLHLKIALHPYIPQSEGMG